MNEDELKDALRGAMVASSPPPSMSPVAAVAAGRAARRRRQAAGGGAVAGLAVVAIAVGAVLVPRFTGDGVVGAAGQSSVGTAPPSATGDATPTVTATAPSVTATAPAGGSKTPWPDGQADRTATSGPRADKSARMLDDLGAALPTGYSAPDKRTVDQWTAPMRRSQSQFTDYYDGDKQIWEYMATTPVARQGSTGVGKLWVLVTTKGSRYAAASSPCDVAGRLWVISGPCVVRQSGGAQVGFVAAGPEGNQLDLDEVAVHLHADGTAVFVGQAAEYAGSGHPALGELPFTSERLVELAVDPKFHLD